MIWFAVLVWALFMLLATANGRLNGFTVLLSCAVLAGFFWQQSEGARASVVLPLVALSAGLFLPVLKPGKATRVVPTIGKRAAAWRREKARLEREGKLSKSANLDLDALDIPGYELIERVGTGGMASVYRARKKRDNVDVAIKIPTAKFLDDDKFIKRFHREAELVRKFNHPNVARTLQHGEVEGRHYMIMEYIEGESLEDYIERADKLGDFERSRAIMRQSVTALSYIHSQGVIHRDVKPGNLMLLKSADQEAGVRGDYVKLMDFGIAGANVATKLTMLGSRIGTPTYMSPEQARGLRTDGRSDIYSMGLVFYELLTGQVAFKGAYELVMHQQIFQMPTLPRDVNPRIPPQLERLIMHMIAKDPDARPALEEIIHRLDEPLEEVVVEDRNRLYCVVRASKAPLRVLDSLGNLIANISPKLPALPHAVALDSQENIFISVIDQGAADKSYPMIHKLSPKGEPLASFGAYGMRPGEFLQPIAIAVAPDDSIWVLDAEKQRLEHYGPDGHYLKGFGGEGAGNGHFNDPRDVQCDKDGGLYVLDYGNRQVQYFDAQGNYVKRWAFRKSRESSSEGAEGLRTLNGMTLSTKGDLYLREAQKGKIYRVVPRQGSLETLPLEGANLFAEEAFVYMAVDEGGNLYQAERGAREIHKYAVDGVHVANIETNAPILQFRADVRYR